MRRATQEGVSFGFRNGYDARVALIFRPGGRPLRHPGLEPGSIGRPRLDKRLVPWRVRHNGPRLKAGVTEECSPQTSKFVQRKKMGSPATALLISRKYDRVVVVCRPRVCVSVEFETVIVLPAGAVR